MKTNLSKIPTAALLKELEKRDKRQPVSEFVKIKRLAKKNKLKLAARLEEGYLEEMPYIMLGILDKKGEFQDFYYSSGLKYKESQQYIPPGFCEAMESTYEYHGCDGLTKEQYIKVAFDVLSKCGYVRAKDWVE